MTSASRVLILGAPFGGTDCAAAAVAEAVLEAGAGSISVEAADFYRRFAPRLASLASLAHATDAAFLPDGPVTVVGAMRTHPDAPAVRELTAGAIASLEAVVAGLKPAVIVCTEQVAGAATAELRERHAFAAVTVLCDTAPHRLWAHPGTDLWCVANDDVRERLALHAVPWDRCAVTGIPSRAAYLAPDARRPRARGPLRVAIWTPGERSSVAASIVEAVRATGADPVPLAPADPFGIRTCDAAVCSGGGELLWSAPAAGVPLVLVGAPPAAERAAADALVVSGAAIEARDPAHLASIVGYLVRTPERVVQMRAAAAAIGRPAASREVAARVVSLAKA